MRAILQLLIPLIGPLLIYIIWLSFPHKRDEQGRVRLPPLAEGPWLLLLLCGFILTFLTLSFWALTAGYSPDTPYRAPYFESGKVIPAMSE